MKMKLYRQLLIDLLFILELSAISANQLPTTIFYNKQTPQLNFAVSEIPQVNKLKQANITTLNSVPDISSLVIASGKAECKQIEKKYKVETPKFTEEQSYAIRFISKNGITTCIVFGSDANGAMYGTLDIAEAIKIGTFNTLTNYGKKPNIVNRGIKFNIPLDLRSPSYTDSGDAAQENIPTVWDMDFWKTMLDNMARDRFNLISLWSLHPFPSMVKVPEYPDVALNDVWRTTLKISKDFKGNGVDFVKPEMLANHEIVKEITIEQKIKFWQEVMQYGKDRGIKFYVFTWNIFTHGVDGKYGITCDRSNDTTINYFRTSVREMIKTYPLLAGIGITAGENMLSSTKYTDEQWLWKTYGEGINDALKLEPKRDFRLIHRYHQTAQIDIIDVFKNLSCPMDFSFKYSIAHMYSMPGPVFIEPALDNMPIGMKTWLTVRNDDVYSFRWGNPGYARDYVNAIPSADKIAGFYMGPDGYTWGRDYLTNEPDSIRQTIIEKQWYSFMIWGRLSYDPTLSNDHFKNILKTHFKEVPADKLFLAWQSASEIFPEITQFFWGEIDAKWFPEACCMINHFYTVEDFIYQTSMPGAGRLTIPQWLDNELNHKNNIGKTPLQVAASLGAEAEKTMKLFGELKPLQAKNKELRLTLGDLESFANLGTYYSEKILGAANLALYDQTSDDKFKALSINHLESALESWKKYAASYTRQYVQPVMYNRVKLVDIPGKFSDEVAHDIEIAKAWKPGSIDAAKLKTLKEKPFTK